MRKSKKKLTKILLTGSIILIVGIIVALIIYFATQSSGSSPGPSPRGPSPGGPTLSIAVPVSSSIHIATFSAGPGGPTPHVSPTPHPTPQPTPPGSPTPYAKPDGKYYGSGSIILGTIAIDLTFHPTNMTVDAIITVPIIDTITCLKNSFTMNNELIQIEGCTKRELEKHGVNLTSTFESYNNTITIKVSSPFDMSPIVLNHKNPTSLSGKYYIIGGNGECTGDGHWYQSNWSNDYCSCKDGSDGEMLITPMSNGSYNIRAQGNTNKGECLGDGNKNWSSDYCDDSTGELLISKNDNNTFQIQSKSDKSCWGTLSGTKNWSSDHCTNKKGELDIISVTDHCSV